MAPRPGGSISELDWHPDPKISLNWFKERDTRVTFFTIVPFYFSIQKFT